MNNRPDRPLVVKCTFDRWNKRITFSSARNCSYDLLKNKVEQCFSLYATSYAISYKDDDGEVTDINTDSDLTEAIQYFQAGSDDPPISSAASILSGRSFGNRKITLRVHITVDYDGPSLSDTSSLASMDEYKGRNGSQASFSFSAPHSVDLDDDSVTVSSRDTGAAPASNRQPSISMTLSSVHDVEHTQSWDARSASSAVQSIDSLAVNGLPVPRSTKHGSSQETLTRTQVGSDRGPYGDDNTPARRRSPYPEDPSAVFERLKLREAGGGHSQSSSYQQSVSADEDRGAAWLRDQNTRTIEAMLGSLPEPSDSDGASFSFGQNSEVDPLEGDLALHQNSRGNYYYSYNKTTSRSDGSSFIEGQSQSRDSGYEDGPHVHHVLVEEASIGGGSDFPAKPRPTSMQLTWLASQQRSLDDGRAPFNSNYNSHRRPYAPHSSNSEPLPVLHENQQFDSDIPPEVLQFVPLGTPPKEMLTDCSECGVILDSIRYVCSACGEKHPMSRSREMENFGKGKAKSDWDEESLVDLHYPPSAHRSAGAFGSSPMSSYTMVNGAGSSATALSERSSHKPLPSLPQIQLSSSPRSTLSSAVSPHSPQPSVENGYELCSGCIESAGVNHALEANLAPGVPTGRGNDSPSSPEDAQRASSQWRRSAPKQKGQLRHAYLEKVWAHRGWEDVEQDDMQTCKCSTCNTVIVNNRFKCASCQKFNLCKACYSQVHEIHPSHAFLHIPDKLIRSRSEPSLQPPLPIDPTDEISMTHPGVKCAHCMLDIIGARFHCAICDSVDICSNCESAGLPGNLDSSDDSHNSSHIMIKIPFPLETTELQTASKRATKLWTDRDAPHVLGGPMNFASKSSSVYSSHARTVMGNGKKLVEQREDDHGKHCSNCKEPLYGVRYQCGSCPSAPMAYNLCGDCETHSYEVHDPLHIFFKIPRPVYKELESPVPFLPDLYKSPAGPPPGVYHPEPREYLKSLVHNNALCDRCVTQIHGEWFRCAYCPKDLCDACEALDTHDDSHVFLVFKAPVDMHHKLRQFAELDNPHGSPPIIPYPLYR
ncbi:hypothetical protein FIBSPDRAFT_861001 [Athelia psychrophila]|uniref:ZZ-type domain-containing protein n=1 Tax=Athelia psychrophila TaxID=1759441 RepID=A0A166JPX8_9AGAM|nr:hypothetical protein FIBSPDRAFT_861001 [Fibularhizoctonia sp. CBS 109695]